MTSVVLCASFPAPGERGDSVAPYFVAEIALAAASVAEAVLRSGAELVFGAHPTISPIVLQTAYLLDAGSNVQIVQSGHFEDRTTDEVHRLVDDLGARFLSVPSEEGLTASLSAMRRVMFAKGPAAAFFCGGMDGLVEEFRLAAEVGAPQFLITMPGGMTAILARELQSPDIGSLVGSGRIGSVALSGRAYGSLALQALELVGLREPQDLGPFESDIYRDADGTALDE